MFLGLLILLLAGVFSIIAGIWAISRKIYTWAFVYLLCGAIAITTFVYSYNHLLPLLQQ